MKCINQANERWTNPLFKPIGIYIGGIKQKFGVNASQAEISLKMWQRYVLQLQSANRWRAIKETLKSLFWMLSSAWKKLFLPVCLALHRLTNV